MTKRTLYTALIALFVGGSAAVPSEAQAQDVGQPAAQTGEVSDLADQGVTVHVTNDSWSEMRIYLVEVGTLRLRHRLGSVTPLSAASFEIPDHFGAESSDLVLVAVAMASREQHRTSRLLTWPGAVVNWRLNPTLSLSHAAVF